MSTSSAKRTATVTTARVIYNVRTPKVRDLENVLTEMADAGWHILKLSEPILGRDGAYMVVVFNKAVMVRGDEATRLMAARTGA